MRVKLAGARSVGDYRVSSSCSFSTSLLRVESGQLNVRSLFELNTTGPKGVAYKGKRITFPCKYGFDSLVFPVRPSPMHSADATQL